MPAPMSPAGATVGTSSAQVVAANARRTSISVKNLASLGTVYLALGEAAQLEKGIALSPGQSYHMSVVDLTPSVIFAIADMAGLKIAIQEYQNAE